MPAIKTKRIFADTQIGGLAIAKSNGEKKTVTMMFTEP